MVVVSDIGDTTNIHPKNKIDVGLRFANLVLNQCYGKTELPISGPLYKSYDVKGSKITVNFDYSKGLKVKGNALSLFEVKDAEGNWHKAKAKISKDKVILSTKVKSPQAVRFAWSSAATPGLFNADNLPASCFTTEAKLTE